LPRISDVLAVWPGPTTFVTRRVQQAAAAGIQLTPELNDVSSSLQAAELFAFNARAFSDTVQGEKRKLAKSIDSDS
jgi:hypothetical protein